MAKLFSQKNPDKAAEVTIRHPREQKELLKKTKKKKKEKAKKNSKSIPLGTFDFDPEEYLDKSLLFDLKKTSEEKYSMQYWKRYPIVIMLCAYYIEHREGTNAFRIKKDKKQAQKDDIIKVIENIDLKIKKSTNK